ncbi:response regulator [Aquisalimonas asiatica]|uniref:Two component transcriptional regulator, LuxR family n=1 Tax=Aquisalimonas asiatica TaxID=406100 RepID=A0A1H8V8N6_9GAMM|nr:response regulator transcription factor [Aquisalimonas asiatica]SEP11647.1 two component transcriptional regulator, LuxR family [Aquisalimonas asiatica]
MATLTPDHGRSLLLVDDHAVVRIGYRRLLEQAQAGWEVEEADSGEAACRLCAERTYSVVVLDLALPGISGLETLRRIRARNPGQRVLVMSMHEQHAFVRQALEAGAMGYVTKSSAPETLTTALARVLDGHRFLGPDLAAEPSGARRADAGLDTLSPREFEIFRMLAAGRRTADIAATLNISYKTAANCSTRIRGKLAVGAPADLTRLAIRAGVMEL